MIHHGDLRVVLPTLEADSIDASATDAPYEFGFMGKRWDSTGVAFDVDAWRAVYRVLKPGAYLAGFGGTRTFHRMTCAIEDAGFEIRDCLSWLYGSGFPKSLDLGDGRGTALKPAWEPCILARKPFGTTVAENVAHYGTGGLNIDACRVEGEKPDTTRGAGGQHGRFNKLGAQGRIIDDGLGRWPANVLLDEEAAAMLDEQSGELVSGANPERRGADQTRSAFGEFKGQETCEAARGIDIGGASRFYYVAKPSREERDYGCEALPTRSGGEATDRVDGSAGTRSPRAGAGRTGGSKNIHPTVKPVELMRWIVRLITPPGGTVLDPFAGSGTTGMACRYEQRGFVGVELEADHIVIANARIAAVAPLFGGLF